MKTRKKIIILLVFLTTLFLKENINAYNGMWGEVPWKIENNILTLGNDESKTYNSLNGDKCALQPWRQLDVRYQIEEIKIIGKIKLGAEDACELFLGFSSVKQVPRFDEKFDTSSVVNFQSMFENFGTNDITLHVERFDTSNANNMKWVFANSKAKEINIGNWDVSKVIYTENMFSNNDNSRLELNLTHPLTFTNATRISSMFWGRNIPNLDMTKFIFPSGKDAEGLFRYSTIDNVDLRQSQLFNVENAKVLFDDANIKKLSLGMFARYTAPVNKLNIENFMAGQNFVNSMEQLNLGPLWQIIVRNQNIGLREVPINNTYVGMWTNIGSGSVEYPENTIRYFSKDLSDPTIPVDGNLIYTKRRNHTNIHTRNITIVRGKHWTANDSIIEAYDVDNQRINPNSFIVVNPPDITQLGTYTTTLRYSSFSMPTTVVTNINEDVEIEVVEGDGIINTRDYTTYQYMDWNAENNFISAFDNEGKQLNINDLAINHNVDTNIPGNYTVTFTYQNIRSEANVRIIENKRSLNVKDSIIKKGSKWNKEDNFVSATNRDGFNISINNINVEGNVDTKTVGKYEITYNNDGLIKTITVTVIENTPTDKTTLNIKNSTIFVGSKWTAANNFVSATDRNGNRITISNIKVSGTVNTSKAGINHVTYTNGSIIKVAIITVNNRPIIPPVSNNDQTKDSRNRTTRLVTRYANKNVKQITTYKYHGNTKVVSERIITKYFTNRKVRSRQVIRRNRNNKITYHQTILRRTNGKIRKSTTYSNYINGTWRKRDIIDYNNRGVRTKRTIRTRYNNRHTRSNTTYSNYSNGKWRRRQVINYRTNKKRSRNVITRRYNNGRNRDITTYNYNRQGQLRSNRNGNASRNIKRYNTRGRRTLNQTRRYKSNGRF